MHLCLLLIMAVDEGMFCKIILCTSLVRVVAFRKLPSSPVDEAMKICERVLVFGHVVGRIA